MEEEPLEQYVYEPFAETEEYREVNERSVRMWIDSMIENGATGIQRLVDLASGVGTMVQLFLDNLPAGWKQPEVVCVDMSASALAQTRERLQPRVENLRLVNSTVEELDMGEERADVAMWGNGIHYLSEESQKQTVYNLRNILKPGGWFLFNSAFCAESRPPETFPFYKAQIAKAVRYMRSLGLDRDKNMPKPQAASFRDQSYYQNLLQQAGFRVQDIKNLAARLYRTAWEGISGFSQYAAGALHGYRADVAAKALRDAVAQSLEEHGSRDENDNLYIQRNWVAMIAQLGTPQQTKA